MDPVVTAFLLLALCLALILRPWRRSKLPFPPGPKPLPILGNVLDMVEAYGCPRPWEKTREWSDRYSTRVSSIVT